MIIKAIDLISKLEIKDFDEFIIMAVGSHSYLHDEISKLYESNKIMYYDLYRNSAYYQNESFRSSSTQNYINIQRFAGIYLYEKSLSENNITMRLIKKGYKFAYNFLKNKKSINIYNLREEHLQFSRRSGYGQTIKSSHLFTIALYLCNEFNILVEYDDWDIENMIEPAFNEYRYLTEYKLELDEYKIAKFLEKYSDTGVNQKGFRQTLNEFLAAISRKKQQEISNVVINNKISNEQINSISKNTPYSKSLNFIARVLQFSDVNPVELQTITVLDYEKVKQIVQVCIDGFENKELFNLEIEQLFVIALMLVSLANEYNITKNEHLEKAQEEVIYETMKLKTEYEERLISIKRREESTAVDIDKIYKLNNKLNNEIQNLKKQLKEREKDISQLSQKYNELEKQSDELYQVLEIYRSQYNDVENIGIEGMIKYISAQNCVIFGGHVKWQDRLQELLPTLRFIPTEKLNIDMSFLKNVDIVIFNESTNSHAMFNKIKSLLHGSDTQILLIGKFNNIELTIQNIYNQLKLIR